MNDQPDSFLESGSPDLVAADATSQVGPYRTNTKHQPCRAEESAFLVAHAQRIHHFQWEPYSTAVTFGCLNKGTPSSVSGWSCTPCRSVTCRSSHTWT